MVKRLTQPTAKQITARRTAADLTQQQAADLVHVTRGTWTRWEDVGPSSRRMPLAAWELFRLKTEKTPKT